MKLNKSGGIWFWKMGRIGGSFYIAKPKEGSIALGDVAHVAVALAFTAMPLWVFYTMAYSY